MTSPSIKAGNSRTGSRSGEDEAQADVVTQDLLKEITRQVELYDPYAIYQRALLAWGRFYQGGIEAEEGLGIRDMLDPHQALGYKRALELLGRENGVMICDGVGLGKSFIALALMEHYCRAKKNVLLIAPKSIMRSSWDDYLDRHLREFREPYGTIHEKFMTDLALDLDEEPSSDKIEAKQKELRLLAARADVIVIDESHNFRTTNTQRYENLYRIVQSLSLAPEKRKKVVLLSATPVNTSYKDLSAQIALITHEKGTIAGNEIANIRSATADLDRRSPRQPSPQSSFNFPELDPVAGPLLDRVLEAIIIQRKRTTCVALAKAAKKTLLFPNREKPTTMRYELSDSFRRVVATAERRFAPTAAFLKRVKDEYERAKAKGVDFTPPKMPAKFDGIKFAAFLPEQYRTAGPVTKSSYQYEITLATLVFVNTIKQLESSPPAFQGILQSLGAGLVARLKYVVGDDANDDVQPHSEWIRTPIHAVEGGDSDGGEESGELAELNGTELDEWLEKAIAARHLHKKLADFDEAHFNRGKWRKDILRDLDYLREIHAECVEARQFPDYKLEKAKDEIRARLWEGQRIVVFSQSQRTAFYLEQRLREEFSDKGVARIDSNVKQETRDDILYAFCPLYNPRPRQVNRDRVDILICTDVLSEGVNMQEAECILNYDIHWNPVRLIQRIGRVDRRLDPLKNPKPHTFSILNCLPPPEINDIIRLVNTVENRRTIINETLGIDASFFTSEDPEGTLREFNNLVDGELSSIDRANERYIRAVAEPDPELLTTLEIMPLGAFGVWDKAPVDGFFALFEMVAKGGLSEADAEHFGSILGRPMLALLSGERVSLDAADILEKLSVTVKGVKSANPGDVERLKKALKAMKAAVNQSFRSINLSGNIQPKLICWMELRRAASSQASVKVNKG